MRLSFAPCVPAIPQPLSVLAAPSTARAATHQARRKVALRAALALTLLASGTSLMAPRAQAADGPTLLKRTVIIQLRRFERYWPNPKAKDPQYSTYSWIPKVRFEILGPVPGGSQFIAEFAKADGSPWMSVNLPTEEVADDVNSSIRMQDEEENVAEKKAIIAVGTFPFKIRLKNALAGTNTVIYSGKYEVVTYPLPRVPAGDKNKLDFVTVEDWRVPVGYLWLNPKLDENVPALSAQMWFRGTGSGGNLKAVLYKDGKQVATSTGHDEDTLPTPSSDDQFNWELWTFTFPTVRGFNKDTSANNWEGTMFLDKNPGDYEIKVLRNDKLARSAKFRVGADGKIVDNGIATQNKLGGIRMVLPVTSTGNADGKVNLLAWKTQAMYGNPLAGFDPAK